MGLIEGYYFRSYGDMLTKSPGFLLPYAYSVSVRHSCQIDVLRVLPMLETEEQTRVMGDLQSGKAKFGISMERNLLRQQRRERSSIKGS